MGLRQVGPSTDDLDAIRRRFGIAADPLELQRPEDYGMRLEYQRVIRDGIAEVAIDIESLCEPSRETSFALTHLEEALMWAGKALHK